MSTIFKDQLPQTQPLLVNDREAARMLSVSPRHLFTLRRTGQIGFVRVGAGAIRYRVKDLEEFAAKNTLVEGSQTHG